VTPPASCRHRQSSLPPHDAPLRSRLRSLLMLPPRLLLVLPPLHPFRRW